jgi:hypothetical protein
VEAVKDLPSGKPERKREGPSRTKILERLTRIVCPLHNVSIESLEHVTPGSQLETDIVRVLDQLIERLQTIRSKIIPPTAM